MNTNKPRAPKVISVGNSFAIVIPKPICRLLRIDRTTEVSLVLDDDRIVIRALSRADRSGQPDRLQLGRMLAILVNHYKMTPVEFHRLSHDGTSWRSFLADVDIGGHVDPVTVARLSECLGRRREAERRKVVESWTETVDAVLLQIPDEQNGSPRTASHSATPPC